MDIMGAYAFTLEDVIVLVSAVGAAVSVIAAWQALLVRGYLGERLKMPIVVDYAMRYGRPAIATQINKLKLQGCNRILVVPMYPQYAASTTATALDAVGAVFARMRNQPEVRTVRHYADHPAYIHALAEQVRRPISTYTRCSPSALEGAGLLMRTKLLLDDCKSL